MSVPTTREIGSAGCNKSSAVTPIAPAPIDESVTTAPMAKPSVMVGQTFWLSMSFAAIGSVRGRRIRSNHGRNISAIAVPNKATASALRMTRLSESMFGFKP